VEERALYLALEYGVVVLDSVDGADGGALARWRRHPAGVDDDDDVEESLHFGVLPLVGVWLEGVLGAAASGELFTEGDVDEGAPRYQAGTESRSMEARTRS